MTFRYVVVEVARLTGDQVSRVIVYTHRNDIKAINDGSLRSLSG